MGWSFVSHCSSYVKSVISRRTENQGALRSRQTPARSSGPLSTHENIENQHAPSSSSQAPTHPSKSAFRSGSQMPARPSGPLFTHKNIKNQHAMGSSSQAPARPSKSVDRSASQMPTRSSESLSKDTLHNLSTAAAQLQYKVAKAEKNEVVQSIPNHENIENQHTLSGSQTLVDYSESIPNRENIEEHHPLSSNQTSTPLNTLAGLPPELIRCVLPYLSGKDRKEFRSTSKKNRDVCDMEPHHIVIKTTEDLEEAKKYYKDNTRLVTLTLEGSAFRNFDLGGLPASLQSLTLSNCDKINYLQHLPASLQSLTLSNCDNLIGVENLPDSLQNLTLNNCRRLTDLKGLPASLQNLTLSKCHNLTDLKDLPISLQNLTLSKCHNLTDKDLQPLSALTQLKSLNLDNCSQITDEALKHLRTLTQLESLRLDPLSRVTDEGLQYQGRLI